MNRNDIFEFALDYIEFLNRTQNLIGGLYISLCYGGFVYEDTRINLYDVFKVRGLLRRHLRPLAEESSSKIGPLREYLADRNEEVLIRKNKEPIAYIQMPADLWDALYGLTEGEVYRELEERFDKFMEEHGMVYDLTEYGRNAALIYLKK